MSESARESERERENVPRTEHNNEMDPIFIFLVWRKEKKSGEELSERNKKNEMENEFREKKIIGCKKKKVKKKPKKKMKNIAAANVNFYFFSFSCIRFLRINDS